ncbi:Putative penicillin-binding protein PbpX [Planctomycetes bacterium Poly30]|uniref:Penicillin-binding protein PbpX n=1 Tax=Saltatorellus ferox TaxID=2528018 RepID=A0A518ET72_9BACT|nr:Putative penicillin-binding protein PbpX [Planctomycetes bacterium Poly30]
MFTCTRTIALLSLSTALLSGAPQEDSNEPNALQAHLENQVESAMEENDLEGMIVVIGLGDETLMERGWGRLPGGHIADPQQLVRAQALVEPLTAIAALQLVGQGKLSLDQPVHSILEDLKWEEGEVQIHHLLAQTSGLIGWDAALPPHERDAATVASLLELVKGQGLEAKPGTCFQYSESNALVLGAIIEKVSGAPLSEWITKHILEPADAESSGFGLEDAPPTRKGSIGSREIGGESISVPEGVHPFGEDEFCTTALDLLRLRRALSDGLILEEDQLEALTEMKRLEDGTPTGYGFGVNRTRVGDHGGISIGGAAEGMSMHMAHYADPDITVIVMAADEVAPVGTIERNLTRLVLDLPLPGISDLELPPDQAARCVGAYQLGCTTLSIDLEKSGHLTLSSSDRSTEKLLYQGQYRFVSSRDPELEVEFVVVEGEKLAGHMILKEHGRHTEAVRFPR